MSAGSGGGWRLISAHSLQHFDCASASSPCRPGAHRQARRRAGAAAARIRPDRRRGRCARYCHDSRARRRRLTVLDSVQLRMRPAASRCTRRIGWMMSCTDSPACASVMLRVSTRKGMSSVTSSTPNRRPPPARRRCAAARAAVSGGDGGGRRTQHARCHRRAARHRSSRRHSSLGTDSARLAAAEAAACDGREGPSASRRVLIRAAPGRDDRAEETHRLAAGDDAMIEGQRQRHARMDFEPSSSRHHVAGARGRCRGSPPREAPPPVSRSARPCCRSWTA